MSKTTRLTSIDFPIHFTARTNNKDHFEIDKQEVWLILLDLLKLATEHFGIKIHCFVLMANHFHLIASTPKNNMSIFMHWFMLQTTKKINTELGRINHLWGNRYGSQIVDDPIYYLTCLKYVYRNPVKAGICEKIEFYPFSTVQAELKKCNLPFKIEAPTEAINIYNSNIHDDLEWYNEPFMNEHETLIAGALKRKKFMITKKGFLKSDIEQFSRELIQNKINASERKKEAGTEVKR